MLGKLIQNLFYATLALSGDEQIETENGILSLKSIIQKDSSPQEWDLFYVTLACDDDPQIKSQKVIRWAWSLFFHKVLLHNVWELHDLFDVTLACDDDPQIEAHKVIHWTLSLFFLTILMHNAEEEPRLFDATLAFDDDIKQSTTCTQVSVRLHQCTRCGKEDAAVVTNTRG